MCHEDDGCEKDEDLWVPFRLTEKQKEKGAEEMENEQRQRNPAPAAGDAVQIPVDFVRQIARPNHDELRISEISPKHGEREEQISQVMENFRS